MRLKWSDTLAVIDVVADKQLIVKMFPVLHVHSHPLPLQSAHKIS